MNNNINKGDSKKDNSHKYQKLDPNDLEIKKKQFMKLNFYQNLGNSTEI